MLTDAQVERYSRQIILPEVGGTGQARLLAAAAVIAGAGELASTVACYVAAAGLGHLRVAPRIAAQLDALNADCHIEVVAEPSVPEAATLVICAGTDAATGDVLNRACVARRLPLLWGRATGTRGVVALLPLADVTAPCLDCQPLPADAGVHTPLAEVTAGFVGTLLATEAIKSVLGIGGASGGRLITYEALDSRVTERPLAKNPACTTCGAAAAETVRR